MGNSLRGFFKGIETDTASVASSTSLKINMTTVCTKCKLDKNCLTPKMKWRGKGKAQVLLLGGATGREEDEKGSLFTGEWAEVLRKELSRHDFDLERDFYLENAVSCKLENKEPTKTQVKYCAPHVLQTIKETKPDFIWLLGSTAVSSFLGSLFAEDQSVARWRKICFPHKETGAWVLCTTHPTATVKDRRNLNLKSVFQHDVKWACKQIDKPKPVFLDFNQRVKQLTEYDDLMDVLEWVLEKRPSKLMFDYETTGLKPNKRGHKIVSISFCCSNKEVYSFPFQYQDYWTKGQLKNIRKVWRRILVHKKIGKMAHNVLFEDRWSRYILDVEVFPWLWDSMVCAHVQDNRRKYTSLNFQSFIHFGMVPYDASIDKYKRSTGGDEFNTMEEAPLESLLQYGGLDSLLAYRIAVKQIKETKKGLLRATNFFFDGIEAFADIYENGICMDAEHYRYQKEKLQKQIEDIQYKLQNGEEGQSFKRKMGSVINLTSNKDLAVLLYDILKQPPVLTGKGNYSVNESTLLTMKTPFVKDLLLMRKLQKIEGTYIAQFEREYCEGKLYPLFGLNIPRSYRSSSSNINFQNIPIRDAMAKAICRGGLMPSSGNKLLEGDYGGIEVCIAACYHKDPKMIAYITDSSSDMHRDVACDIWQLPQKEITKDIRFYAKNGWTFPQFYGDWYSSCAQSLSKNCFNLKTESGILLKEHIQELSGGKRPYDYFLNHCKEVEYDFWNNRFPTYKKWKEEINSFYQRHGYIETHFGFRFVDYMNRNEVTNRQTQATAFHCLLWTFIEVNNVARQEKWGTRIIGQVHDSIIFDLVPEEQEHVIETVVQIGTKDIREEFDWIIVPLEMEFEVTPIDGSWDTKKEV